MRSLYSVKALYWQEVTSGVKLRFCTLMQKMNCITKYAIDLIRKEGVETALKEVLLQ